MQQGDQPGAALVVNAALPRDPSADLACRARQRLADPGFQPLPFGGGSSAHAPFVVEDGQALDLHLLGSAGTSPGSCRRPQTAPWQSLRSSCRHLAAPKHWRGETADVRPTRRESTRSGLVAIRGPGSRDGSSMHQNRIHRRRQAIPTDFSGVVVYVVPASSFHTFRCPVRWVATRRGASSTTGRMPL